MFASKQQAPVYFSPSKKRSGAVWKVTPTGIPGKLQSSYELVRRNGTNNRQLPEPGNSFQ
jgi:hypothetical protein